MIRIEVAEPTDRVWRRWRTECADATRRLVEKFAFDKDRPAPTTADIESIYKRKSIKDAFFFSDTGPFRGKCAYCETYLRQFHNPDVEHFRPKLGVTDADDNPIVVDYGWGNVYHWGYFWLAYDWRNLLPSCVACNQASALNEEKIGKHNRFPVSGSYARYPAEVSTEQPELINPLEEEPSNYLRVDVSTGLLEPKNGSSRGAKTIGIFGLNIRDKLRERRLGKVREVQAIFIQAVQNPDKRSELLAELKALRDGGGEYTAVVRAVLDDLKPVAAVWM